MSAPSKERDNFKVAVRVRPLLPREAASESNECVEVDATNKTVVVNKPSLNKRPVSRIGIEDFGELVRSDPNVIQSFTFDLVLSSSTTQEDIFQSCASDIVTSVLDGYNGSIIASGQTNSGKTYTIEGGVKESQGIIPRATQLIFSRIGSSTSQSETDQFLVRTSYLQIYNEKISDLLDPRRDNLKIREDGTGGVFVEALSEHVVRNTDEVMKLIQDGARLRTTSITKMNKESSRSHAVFTIIVEHAEQDGSGGNIVTIGKLRLVDLAGSERLDVEAESRLQEETKNINVSLHNFSKVVTALTTPSMKHVPYRDSKLTRLLQDCLGGNCKTTLIATVTPVSECYNESINTLKFAKRAKNIKNTALVNKDMSEKALLSSYQAEIKKLKQKLQQKGPDSSAELQELQRERLKAQREKEEVKSKLEAQQKIVIEAEADREKLTVRIQELENKLLYGGKKNVIEDSDEFKLALLKEQERLKNETATQYELKLAELDMERKRLENEKLKIQKEREEFTRLNAKKSDNEKGEGYTEMDGRSFQGILAPRRAASAAALHPKGRDRSGSLHQVHALPSQKDELKGNTTHDPVFGSPELDMESRSALQEYMAALSHPHTGIPCQELGSGIQIFTGSAAVYWFMKNMEGVSSMQSAQAVGQRLMELGIFTEIQGGNHFVVSSVVYYQFCSSTRVNARAVSSSQGTRTMVTRSLGSFPKYSPVQKSAMSSAWSVSSSSISRSVASLGITGDLIEHFGLADSFPKEIHIEALYGERAKVKTLISESDINITDAYGRTPLMYAVIGKQAKCCLLLIRCGADVNCTDSSGLTALLLAAKYEYEDVIKILLKSGAETHYMDSDGRTVFHLAAKSQNYKCLEYLCRYGTNAGMNTRDNTYRTPLLAAVLAKLPGHVKRLLMAKADLGISDHEGRTALHYAVTCNSLPCAQAIVETKPDDINLIDTAGLSPLHLACREGSPEIVHYLSSFSSCDINLQDQDGCTPLHYAVTRNQTDIVEVLLSKGASVVITDNKKKTPVQYSIEMGFDECAHILRKF